MKHNIFFLAPFFAAATAPLRAQAPINPEPPPAIIVTAEGKRTVAPDRASVFLSILNRGRTPTAAGAENARIATAIRNAVQAVGIDRAQISTLNYNVTPDVDIIQGPQGRETRRDSAYIAMNTVRVEIRNIDLVSRVIDTALTAGATNVASVSYWLSDPSRPRRDATVDAVRQARENAEAIAAAAGGSLGDLIELRTDPVRIFGPQPYEADQGIAMARMQASVPTPVSPRDIDITAYVTARWKFVKGSR
jgi:uncharacterized protein YggE